MAPSRLGRVVVGQHLRLLLLVVALVLAPDPVDGLAGGRGGQPGAGVRGDAVGRPALDGGRERLGSRLLGDVEVTEPPGQGGDHPRPLLVVRLGDRLPDVGHALLLAHSRVGVVGQELEHLLRAPTGGGDLRGPLQRDLARRHVDDREAADVLLALRVRAVGDRPVGARPRSGPGVSSPAAKTHTPCPPALRLHGTHGLPDGGQVLPRETHVAVIEQDHVARHLDALSRRRGRSVCSAAVYRNGRTSTFRLQAFEPSAASLERHVEVGGLDDPEAGEVLLRLHDTARR